MWPQRLSAWIQSYRKTIPIKFSILNTTSTTYAVCFAVKKKSNLWLSLGIKLAFETENCTPVKVKGVARGSPYVPILQWASLRSRFCFFANDISTRFVHLLRMRKKLGISFIEGTNIVYMDSFLPWFRAQVLFNLATGTYSFSIQLVLAVSHLVWTICRVSF